jgi:hypothetical protein
MDRMKALSDGMQMAVAATAIQQQTEAEHRQVAQIQRIAELLVQTEEAADAEVEGARPRGASCRLPPMVQMMRIAKSAWLATADCDSSRNPQARAVLDFRPDLMDADNPRDVRKECALAGMAIDASWVRATAKHAPPQMEQPLAVIKLEKEVREAGGREGYLLRLLASDGPQTEDDLIAAVHPTPGWEQLIPEWLAKASKNGLIKAVVPGGGVIERWQITNAGRTASGIPTNPPN